MLRGIGTQTLSILDFIGSLTTLFFKSVFVIFRPRSPRFFKWTSGHFVRIGSDSLWIVSLILVLMGMVIALQTAYQMAALGANALIPRLLAVSMARELGPVMTAFVVAGRAGASMTAEIGAMKVTEQVDALESMSANPIEYLVSTRLLATMIAMPCLAIYGIVLGITGGYVVCLGKLGMSSAMYWNGVFEAVVWNDFASGLIKAFVFGIVITIVSCHAGLKVSGGAQGVGRATMHGVVFSFLFIVLCDFLFTIGFYIFR